MIMQYVKSYDNLINESLICEKETTKAPLQINNMIEFKKNKFVVICVSANYEQMFEIQYLKNACAKCDAEFIYVNFTKDENFIRVIDGTCVLCMDDQMYSLDKTRTLVIKRHAKLSDPIVAKNCSILTKNDFLVINSASSISISSDKVKTAERLKLDGISQAKSFVLDSTNIENFDCAINDMEFDFPVIAKVNRGSRGNGVFLFESAQSLKGVAQYILSHKEKLGCNSIIVQEKIDAEYDLRLHVLRKESDPVFRNGDNYEVFAAMKRKKLKDDYRSNASLGAKYEYYEPTEDEKQLAIDAAKSVKCAWCGVDIMKDKHTGKLYVLEVNSTPSLKGITEIAEKDPATQFIKAMKEAFVGHLKNENDNIEKMILGYKETFYINDFDMPLVALLDTGNGSLTSILANDIKVNKEDKTVEWTLFGKRFKTKYDGDVRFRSSAGEHVVQPTTRLDITHNGITYKNIRVKLNNVGDKHSINKSMNVNRDLLSKMNAVVDTSKKHVNSKHSEIKKNKIKNK